MHERQIPVESAMPEQESPFEDFVEGDERREKPAHSQEVAEADTVEVTRAEPISSTPEDVISPVAVTAGETRSEPQPVYDVTKGPIETRTSTEEMVKQMDDGLTIKQKVTTTKHYTPLIKTTTVGGRLVDSVVSGEQLVGMSVEEDILIVPPDVSEPYPEDATRDTSVQEFEEIMPDGTWLKTKVIETVLSVQTTPEVIEGEVQTRTDVREHQETLEDGTTVKTTTTITEHYRTITEGTKTSEVIVGQQIDEVIYKLAPGVSAVDQEGTEMQTTEQESRDTLPDGAWQERKVTKTTVKVVVPGVIESEVQQRTDVQEHHKMLDDGTNVKITTTTTDHYKTITVGDDTTEVPVGKEIDEVILEMAPGVTHVEEDNTTSHTSEDESEDTADDGTWVKRKTTTTTVRLVQREIVESEIMTKEDVQQQDEVLDDGTTVRTTTRTTVFYKTHSDGVESTEVPVGTEVDKTIVQLSPGATGVDQEGVTSKTTDQETEDMLPDGTWLRQKTTTTVISLTKTEVVESDVQTRVDIKEQDEVLDDGTTVKITTTTTEHYKTVTEGLMTSEVIVGREIYEDVTELAPGVSDVNQKNTTSETDEQESEDMMPDGSWLKRKTVTTAVTLVEEVQEEVPLAAAPEEPEVVESEVQQRKDVKEHHEVLDDGTNVKITTTTTDHYKTITVGNDTTEVPVGKEIDEVILEMAPGVTHVEEDNTTSHTSEDESEETADDGTWVKRKTTTTTVSLVQREVVESEVMTKEDVQQQDEVLDDGTTVRTTTRTTVFYKTRSDGVESTEVPVGTEVDKTIVQLSPGATDVDQEGVTSKTTDQETEDTLPDGTWLRQKTTTTVISLTKTEVVESDVQTRVDIKEQDEVLDDGTTVKITTTTTEHYKTVTEGVTTSEVIVGREIYEDVTELAPGVSDVNQKNTTSKTDEQESEDMMPDGSWLKRKTVTTAVTLMEEVQEEVPLAAAPEEPEVVESEVQQRKDVKEHHEVLDDGTNVKITTTTTDHYKTITVGDDTTEVPVGKEIDEVIIEMAPGVTHVEEDNTTSHTSEDESEETADDGTWVKRKTTTTTVSLVQREVVESEVMTKEDVQQQDEVLDDGTTVRTTTRTTVFYKTRSDGVESTEVPVGTEVDKTIVQLSPGATDVDQEGVTSKTTDQETEDTLPDGTWLRQKTTTTVISLTKTEVVESDVQTRVDIKEQDEVLDDGTTVKITTTTTEHYKTVTEGVTTSEVIVGREIYEDVTELAPGVSDVNQKNTTSKTDEQESEDMMPDGSWLKRKTVTTAVTLMEEVQEEVPLAAAPEEPEVVESEVQQRKDVKEHHKVLDDGTNVKITTTTTDHYKTITVGDDTTEVPVGKEIDEVIIEMAPGVTHVEEDNTTSHTSEDESEETADDGTWVKRKTTTTTVSLVQREVVESEVMTKEDVQQQDEVLDDGTTVRTTTRTTVFYKTRSDGVESTEVPVGTEVDKTIVQLSPGATDVDQEGVTSKTTDQETEDMLPDGTWMRQKTTTTVISLTKTEVVESDVQTRVDIKEQDEVLDDGTTVKITTTTTEHYKTVTEGVTTSEVIVGREIYEDVTELAPGVSDVNQKNTTSKTDEQESEDMMPDGSWLKRKTVTTAVTLVEEVQEEVPLAAAPEEPEVVESDVQQRKDVKEHHEVLDDGTNVKITTTTTDHYKTITVGDDTTEVPVGKEIDEVILEMAPGVTHVDEYSTTSKTTEHDSDEVSDDGTWVKRHTQTTVVSLIERVDAQMPVVSPASEEAPVERFVEEAQAPVEELAPVESPVSEKPEDKEEMMPVESPVSEEHLPVPIPDGEIQTRTDVQEHEEVLDDGTNVKTVTVTTEHYIVTVDKEEIPVGHDIQEEIVELCPGVTDIHQENTRTKTSVQESQKGLPGGRWEKRRVTRITVTAVRPEELLESIAADVSSPDVQSRTDVQEHEDVLDDGTTVKTTTTTFEYYRISPEGEEMPVGKDVSEDIIEMGPGVTDVEQANTKTKTSVQDSLQMSQETWVKRKVTRIVVTLIEKGVEFEQVAAIDSFVDAAQAPAEELIPIESPVSEKPEEKEEMMLVESPMTEQLVPDGIPEGEIKVRTDVQEHEEVLDDGTSVKTVTTTNEHYIVYVEDNETKEILIGKEIHEEFVELSPGVADIHQENTKTKTSVQDSQKVQPNGYWEKRRVTRITVTAVRPEELLESIAADVTSPDVQRRTDVQEHEDVLDDGTNVKTTTTTVEYYRVSPEGEEMPVGKDVSEDIIEMGPGVTDVEQANTRTKISVQESHQMIPEGTWVQRKVTRKTVTVVESGFAAVPARIPDGEIQTRTDVQEHEEVLDDGTNVKTVTTTTEHYIVTVEEDETKEIPVGQDIQEEIVELSPGVTDIHQENTRTKTSVQESQKGLPGGRWEKRRVTRITVTAVRPEELLESIAADVSSPDVQRRTDVQEHEDVLDDGTNVKTTTITVMYYRVNPDGEEMSVGKDINEEIVELGPGITDGEQANTKTKVSVQDSLQMSQGIWVKRKVTRTSVNTVEGSDGLTAIPAELQKDVEKQTDVQEKEEVLDDGTTVKTTTTTIVFYRWLESGETTAVGKEINEEIVRMAPGVTDMHQNYTKTTTSVEESHQMLADQTWVKRKVTTITITLVQPGIASLSPADEIIPTEPTFETELQQEVSEDTKTVPAESELLAGDVQTRTDIAEHDESGFAAVPARIPDGEIQTRTDVQEHEEVLDDGTNVKTVTTTTEHYIVTVEEDETKEIPVGQDIQEEIVELSPGVTDIHQENTRTKTSVQESQKGLPGGRWEKRRVTRITVTAVRPEELLESIAADVSSPDVQRRTDVQEHEDVLDDGTNVKTTTITVMYYRVNPDGEDMPVGKDINEEIVELGPGITDGEQANTKTKVSVQDSLQMSQGIWVKRKVTRTSVNTVEGSDGLTAIPAELQKDVEKQTDVQEKEEVLDDGTTVKTTTTTIVFYRWLESGETTAVGKEINEEIVRMAPGVTDMHQNYTKTTTSVEESHQMLADQTWVKRKVTTITITLVQPGIASLSPADEIIPTEPTFETELQQEVSEDKKTVPAESELLAGDVQTRTDIAEHDEVLDDGTTIKTTTTTTNHYKVAIDTDGMEREVAVGQEINKDILELPPGVNDMNQPNSKTGTSVQQSEHMCSDGTWVRCKTTKITVVLIDTPMHVKSQQQEDLPPGMDVVEYQETLSTGVVVKRRVIRTFINATTVHKTIITEMPDGEVFEESVTEDISGTPQDTMSISAVEQVPMEQSPADEDMKPEDGETVEEYRDILPDGTVVIRKRVVRSTVTKRIRRVGPDGEVIEEFVTDSDILSEASSLSDIRDRSPSDAGSPVESDDEGKSAEGMRVFMDTKEGEPVTETDVQEFEETLPDGTIVKRKVVKTTQKQTIVKRVIMDSPEGEMPAMTDDQGQWVAMPEPEMVQYGDKIFGEPETTSDVQEYDETLPDGTVVKRRVVTKRTQQMVTERTIVEGAGDMLESMNGMTIPAPVDETTPQAQGIKLREK